MDDFQISQNTPTLRVVRGSPIINIGFTNNLITVSLAIQVDGLSMIVVAYSSGNIDHFIATVSLNQNDRLFIIVMSSMENMSAKRQLFHQTAA